MKKGQAQPNATAIEIVLLADAMLNRGVCEIVVKVLEMGMFYDDRHGMIYAAIKSLHDNYEPVDTLTVTERLKQQGNLDAVTPYYIVTMINQTAFSPTSAEYYCKIIKQKYAQRKIIEMSMKIQESAYADDADPFSLMDAMTNGVAVLQDDIVRGFEKGNKEAVKNEIMDILAGRIVMNPMEIMLSPQLNDILNLSYSDNGKSGEGVLIGIYGKSGHGKSVTQRTIQTACWMRKYNFWSNSAETSIRRMYSQFAAVYTGIPVWKIMRGNVRGDSLLSEQEQEKVLEFLEEFISSDSELSDYAGISVEEFTSKCEKMMREKGARVFMYDRLELFDTAPDGNENAHTRHIVETLRKFVKRTGAIVIIFIQTRKGQKGQDVGAEDILGSGAINNNLHIGLRLRNSYVEASSEEERNEKSNKLDIKVTKNTNGRAGDEITLDFNPVMGIAFDGKAYPQFLYDPSIQYYAPPVTQKDEEDFDDGLGKFAQIDISKSFSNIHGSSDKDDEVPF